MRIGVDLGGTKVEGIRLKDNGQIDKKINVLVHLLKIMTV